MIELNTRFGRFKIHRPTPLEVVCLLCLLMAVILAWRGRL